jgi:hypothetical protein
VCGRAAIIPSLPQPQRDRILTFAVLAFGARLAFRRSLVVRRVDGPGLSGIERATHTREVLTAPAALPWTSCGAALRLALFGLLVALALLLLARPAPD